MSQALRSLLLVTLFQTVRKPMTCPLPVCILATVVAYSMKIEFGIKVSITSEAASYQVPEKKFRTCVKGVKYDSGSQKARQSGVITPKFLNILENKPKKAIVKHNLPAVKEKVTKRTFLQKCNHYKENRNVAKDSEKWTVTRLLNFTEVDQLTLSPSRPFTPPFPNH